MNSQTRNIAVVLAGGVGSRLGDRLPKQFLKVAGKKIIEHTLDVFENNDLIDEIAVVCQPQYNAQIEQIIVDNRYRKVRRILAGGAERYHSSLSAIKAYDNDNDRLLFHDAVRPLVNDRIIADCVAALDHYDAVDVAIPATDTIIEVDSNEMITAIPERSRLRGGQTPQCFRRGIINQAYERALKDPDFRTTDDCGVVRRYMPQVDIKVVRGEAFNIKITYMEDLFLLDKLYQLRSQTATHTLSETTRAAMSDKVVVVFGGSKGIGLEVVRLSEQLGARVFSFSRGETGTDVSRIEHVTEALNQVARQTGGVVDYIVCSAGLLIRNPLGVMSADDIHASINTNYLGTVNVAQAAWPLLRKSKGSLLFYTSSSYTRGRMMYSVYSSTKAAIVNLTQALAEEWHTDGIRVNCINPERTRTPMRVSNFGVEPEGTLLEPEVVAVATLNTLVSRMTGEVVDVRRKM